MRLYTDGHWRSVWDACVIYLTWPLVIGSLKIFIPGVNRAIEICERLMFLILCVVFHLSALRACWLIIQSSFVFPLAHSAKEARNNTMDESGSEPNLHPMINDPPLSAHLTLSLSRVKWAEDNNKQCKTKQIPCPLSPHLHTPTWSIERCPYTHIHTASILWMHRLWRCSLWFPGSRSISSKSA